MWHAPAAEHSGDPKPHYAHPQNTTACDVTYLPRHRYEKTRDTPNPCSAHTRCAKQASTQNIHAQPWVSTVHKHAAPRTTNAPTYPHHSNLLTQPWVSTVHSKHTTSPTRIHQWVSSLHPRSLHDPNHLLPVTSTPQRTRTETAPERWNEKQLSVASGPPYLPGRWPRRRSRR